MSPTTETAAGAAVERATPEALRRAALAVIDEHLDNLKRCIHWLIEHAITVLAVDMRHGRARPQITVAASPRLYVLCKDDCANIGRRQDGALTIYAWAARRFGCDLRWEEVSA